MINKECKEAFTSGPLAREWTRISMLPKSSLTDSATSYKKVLKKKVKVASLATFLNPSSNLQNNKIANKLNTFKNTSPTKFRDKKHLKM